MTNRIHQLLSIVCLATAVSLATDCAQAAEKQKPNILFIFADDQAFDTINALGYTEVETPNLDRLARNGVTFTHAYNMGAWHGAVCVASRTMLTTGRFVWKAQADERRLNSEYIPQGRLWPQLLQAAGYDTYFTGKWHVKADAEKAFKVANHVRPGMPKQTKQGYNRPTEGRPDPWKPWDESFGGFWEGGRHWSEIVGDDATGYIRQAASSENPFFMYIAFNAPHDPRQSPKEYVDKYPLDKIDLPTPFLPDHPHEIGSNRIRDEQLAPFPRTEYAVKVNRQEYYAIITHMDTQVGRILDALDESGEADNTYIVFTADHGLACGHHGLMGKQNMYDHSVRVPFMIVGPGLAKDECIDSRIYLQDVMPTSLELGGAEIPEYVQFKSIMPLLAGTAEQSYDAIYGGYTNTQRMVTAGDYKLIVYPKIQKTLLFDLKNDPWETEDLAEKPEFADNVAELKAMLKALQVETGDALELD